MKPVIKTWSTVVGHVAMALILLTYLAFSADVIGKTPYLATGMLTSLMMGFHGWERKSYPLMTLNLVWFAISGFGLVRG